MSRSRDDDLHAMRLEALRLRMQVQRALIAERIGPEREATSFPRSLTMRLLLRNPWRVAGLVASVSGGQRKLLLRAAAAAVGLLAARAALRRNRRG
jgi:hypothetical protein